MLHNKKTGKRLDAAETLEFFNQVHDSIINIELNIKKYINQTTETSIITPESNLALLNIQELLKNSLNLILDQTISKEPDGNYGVWSEPISGQMLNSGWIGAKHLTYNNAMCCRLFNS